jgi:hypothetical protein
LLQRILSSLRVVKVNDERLKALLLDSGRRGFPIAGAVHGQAEGRQNSAQNIRGGIVGRNQ